jgi:hypothetical protein
MARGVSRESRALSGVGLSILDNLTRLDKSRLHHDHAGFELSFGRTFEQLIDFFLHLLADLIQSTFLAYRAGNILDFHGSAGLGSGLYFCSLIE